jgi:hypothetical protein
MVRQCRALGVQHRGDADAGAEVLGLLDPNDALCAVDMLDLQPDHLAGTQAAAIAEAEQHASLEAGCHRQQRRVSSWLITKGIFCGTQM